MCIVSRSLVRSLPTLEYILYFLSASIAKSQRLSRLCLTNKVISFCLVKIQLGTTYGPVPLLMQIALTWFRLTRVFKRLPEDSIYNAKGIAVLKMENPINRGLDR